MFNPSPVSTVSFVVCGRNDNYMGNYNWRITTGISLLVRNLVRLGLQHRAQIILADWNSPVPFHKEMRLTPEAAGIMNFLVVPPEIAIPAQKDSKFPNPIAQNAAIRRARGDFIAVTDADVVLTSSFLLVLFAILDGKVPVGSPPERTFMISGRAQIPTIRTAHNPPMDEIESFLRRNRGLLKRDRLFEGLGGPAGFVMLHRELWHETRGYDERLIHAGWNDIELHLRVGQKYPWVDLTNFGAEVIHIEHYTAARGTGTPPRKSNGFSVSRHIAANDENWGLGNMDLQMHPPQVFLDDAALAEIKAAAELARAQPVKPATIIEELKQPAIGQLLEATLRAAHHDPAEYDLLRILAWYSLTRRPRAYLELGVQRSAAPTLVAAGCSTCEAYLVDQWAPDDTGGNPPIYISANSLGTATPQAQTHYITGDLATAVDRLFGSIAPGLTLDLAVIRTDPALGDAEKNTLALADRLAPGGAIAVSAHDPAAFARVWNILTARFPASVQFQIRRSQADPPRIGVIYAVSPAG